MDAGLGEAIDPNLIIDAAAALETPGLSFVRDGRTRPESIKILRTLAKGGYGEVYVVEMDGAVYAMKRVAKDLVLKNTNTTFFMNEKQVMTSARSEWIVQCQACVQDSSHLYYVMDFIPGGDLMCYLSKIDVLPERDIRFYAAEIFTAVHAMHELGWIHRDLKPDNILIDGTGHVKLGDFGSSIRMVDGAAESSVTVGTPDYVSPDLLVTVGDRVRYGAEVDFWTVGVILYEMFYGVTPFYSDSLRETYSKINRVEYVFGEGISEELRDLISNLLCERTRRYGMAEVRRHVFFEGVDWARLRESEPPYLPEIREDGDTSNFVDTEFTPDNTRVVRGYRDFVGFTYDPTHAERVIDMVLRYRERAGRPAVASAGQTGAVVAPEDGRCGAGCPRVRTEEHGRMLASRDRISEECARMKSQISSLGRDKEYKEELIAQYNQSLKGVLDQIVMRNEEHETLAQEIKESRAELSSIKQDIASKMSVLRESDSSLVTRLREELGDVKRMIERAQFQDRLDRTRKIAYWFYKENASLRAELKTRQTDADIENKNLEELKKQLRIKRTEVRECQQKIEQEIAGRGMLEEQLRALKAQLRSSVKAVRNMRFSVVNAMSNREMELALRDDLFVLRGFPPECIGRSKNVSINGDELCCAVSNVYVRELKNNELHHLSYKKRTLCVRVHFLAELARSSSSSTRRSLKALEADYQKESRILAGLESLIKYLDGITLKDAMAQKEGSERKLSQLREEIERAKKSTIAEHEVEDDENVAEFNNHLFYEKTVARGTLCDYCNDVLFGVYKQAYCCRDCLLVVHKSCYILGDVSCELNRAMRSGSSVAVLCKTAEDRERLLRLNKL